MVSRTPAAVGRTPAPVDAAPAPRTRRRNPVNEDGTRIDTGQSTPNASGGWRRADDVAPLEPAAQPPQPKAAPAEETQPSGGWRRVKPGEQPE
jgi:hypothetical protein